MVAVGVSCVDVSVDSAAAVRFHSGDELDRLRAQLAIALEELWKVESPRMRRRGEYVPSVFQRRRYTPQQWREEEALWENAGREVVPS